MKTISHKVMFSFTFIFAWLLGVSACAPMEPSEPSEPSADSYNSSPQVVALTPDEINWGACPGSLSSDAKCAVIEGDPKTPGPFAMRLMLPEGYKLSAHWHPGIEHVTVISGTLHLVSGDDLAPAKAKAFPAGSYLVLPAKIHMMGWLSEASILQLHGVGPWGMTAIDH